MENASKALIIVAEVLIGVLLLTLLVGIFNSMGMFSKTVNDNIAEKNLNEFNAQFIIYDGRKDLTAQEVITIGNLAKNYNKTEEAKNASLQIKVLVRNIDSSYANLHTLTDEQTYMFIQKFGVDNKKSFTCISVTYNEQTGRVNRIELKLNG